MRKEKFTVSVQTFNKAVEKFTVCTETFADAEEKLYLRVYYESERNLVF